MLKRGIWLFVLLLCLCFVVAQSTPPGQGGDTSNSAVGQPDPTVQSACKDLGQSDPCNIQTSTTVSPDGSRTIEASSYTYNGVTYTQLSGAVINPDGSIRYADSITLPNGVTLLGATNPTASGSSYQVDQVQTLQQGPIVITNGYDVVYDNGCISASSADSLVHIDTVATQINSLTYCDATLEVAQADSVWAGCVYMEDVEDSTITASTQITIESDANANFSLRDCASNQIQFEALSDNASLIISKETVSPTYTLDDVSLTITKTNLTEIITSNCTAIAEIHRQNGVEKMVMCPVSTYSYDTKDPLRDFSIRAWQDFHTIYLKKRMDIQFPSDASACKSCSLIDLANHRIDIRGVIDFNKNQLDRMGKNLNAAPVPFFTTGNKDAKAILLFDNDNAIVNELLIQSNAPPYRTYVSNYLTISESIQTNNKTERLLGINEKITKADISHSLIKSYKTSYSNSSLLVDNNELTYQREGTNIKVLPDQHAGIKVITDALSDKRALLLLPLLGLLFIPRRKGQISLFILMGVFALIIVSILLYTAGIVQLPNERIHVTERQQVQEYVTQCLAIGGKNSLDVFGIQGSYFVLPQASFKSPQTAFAFENNQNTLIPLDVAQNAIASDAKQRVLTCIDNFKGLSGVSTEIVKEPEIKVSFAPRDTTFRMSYPFFVKKTDQRWDFDEFAITIDIPVLQHYLAANATITSEVLNDGEINLDQIPSSKMTFFPQKQVLMTFIESVSGKMLEPYYFYFANR